MDEEDFTTRAENLKNRLFRMAFLYLGSESLALDAVDESIYKAFKALRSLREDTFFETWLTRILINECKKELKHRKREQPLDTIPETNQEQFDLLPLKEAIRRLPQDLKDVIITRYFSDFTLSETAKALDIPQGTVVTRQRRALSLLKLELSEEEYL